MSGWVLCTRFFKFLDFVSDDVYVDLKYDVVFVLWLLLYHDYNMNGRPFHSANRLFTSTGAVHSVINTISVISLIQYNKAYHNQQL